MLRPTNEQPMQLWYSFWEIHKSMMQCIDEAAHKKGLSIPQYIVLMTLLHCGEVSQKVVRERTKLPKSTLSQAIDKLEEKGFVARASFAKDRRKTGLIISQQGKQIIHDIGSEQDGVYHIFTRLIDVLSGDELKQLFVIHEKIHHYLETKGKESEC